jgi:hypothetical protein
MDRRSTDQIVAALGGTVAPDSVLCTDGLSAYTALAAAVGAEHRVFDPPEDDWLKKAVGHPPRQKGALGLGRVNGHHERMKTLINRVLRGVSTKSLVARHCPKGFGGHGCRLCRLTRTMRALFRKLFDQRNRRQGDLGMV